MAIQYADFLSASNIYNEVMKEIQTINNLEEFPRKNLYKRILKNCNKIIMERFSDYHKQEMMRFYIEKILLPIYKNHLNEESAPSLCA